MLGRPTKAAAEAQAAIALAEQLTHPPSLAQAFTWSCALLILAIGPITRRTGFGPEDEDDFGLGDTTSTKSGPVVMRSPFTRSRPFRRRFARTGALRAKSGPADREYRGSPTRVTFEGDGTYGQKQGGQARGG